MTWVLDVENNLSNNYYSYVQIIKVEKYGKMS